MEEAPQEYYVDPNFDLLSKGASEGKEDVVLQALTAGVDVNENQLREGPLNALHLAAHAGHKNVVSLLLEKGADIDALGSLGWDQVKLTGSALHFAAAAGKLDVIKLLLEKGATVTGDGTDNSELPIHSAAGSGQLDVVKFFIERNKSDVDAEDGQGETPLFKAAENGKLDVVKFLVENGCKVNVRTVVRTALIAASFEGRLDVVTYLLGKGGDANVHGIAVKDTALHLAAEAGHEDVIGVLLANKADKGAKDDSGKTPAERATKESTKKLLS